MPDPVPSLLVVISAHGYGHLSQIAPVIDGLYRVVPALEVTVQTEIPQRLIARRLDSPFSQVEQTADIGMLMAGPTVIRWEDSLAAYRQFHRDWDHHMQRQLAVFDDVRPDLVLTDIPYLPIEAATQRGIRVAAYSSLNWADIIDVNAVIAGKMQDELKQMRDAYQQAEYFIQPEPSMPMTWLRNRCPVGPVMRVGENIRDRIDADLGLKAGDRLVLASLGGIPLDTPLACWPRLPGVHWMIADSPTVDRDDIHLWDEQRYRFIDVLASADLVITKPGYGMFTEIAAVGVPALNIARPDWGETAVLEAWLAKHVALRTIPLAQLLAGEITAEVEELLEAPRGEPVAPTGIAEAVAMLAPML